MKTFMISTLIIAFSAQSTAASRSLRGGSRDTVYTKAQEGAPDTVDYDRINEHFDGHDGVSIGVPTWAPPRLPDDFYCLPGRKSVTPSPCRFYTPAETDAVVAAGCHSKSACGVLSGKAGPRCVDNTGTFTLTNDDNDGTEQHVTCAMVKAHGSCNIQPFKNKASESILQWTILLNCPKLCAGTEYEIAPGQSPDPNLVYMLNKLGTVSGTKFTADRCAPASEAKAKADADAAAAAAKVKAAVEAVRAAEERAAAAAAAEAKAAAEAVRAAEESRRAAAAQAMRQMQERMQQQMRDLQKAMKLFG